MNKDNHPRISIIMPNLNGEKHLEKSINSFLNQSYKNKELLIIDYKSEDKSHQIISKYKTKYPNNIKWIKIIDKGISHAINIGISKSSGDIIGYLGSDDILIKNIFNTISYYNSIIDFDAIYFNSYTYYLNNKKFEYRVCPKLDFNRLNLLKYGTIVGLQNIFIKRNVFDEYKYNENNKYSMDYELFLELTSNEGLLFLYIDETATINIFDGNISGSLTKRQRKEAFYISKKYCNNLKPELFIATTK